MNKVLLLGAGFSCNWGGWTAADLFAKLVGTPEVKAEQPLRELLFKHKNAGTGFEGALYELQRRYATEPTHRLLVGLQGAIIRVFDQMNANFISRTRWEFSQQLTRQLGPFMSRFDAIFSLNQDVLLEKHYCGKGLLATNGPRRWGEVSLPGLRRQRPAEPLFHDDWARATWMPTEPDFAMDSNMQPLFKLHGSSNWRDPTGEPLLVMGGGKEVTISRHPILKWYADQFRDYMVRAGTKLMVIGYGFGDEHINDVLEESAGRGMELFYIGPDGADVGRKHSPTHIKDPCRAEKIVEKALVNASTRQLDQIFSDNAGPDLDSVLDFIPP